MSKKEILKRYLLFILGLFSMALGIALMVQARLGTSPISSIPYVFSLKFTFVSLGILTFIWNMILILGQIIILGRKFEKYQLLQIPLSVIFGVFVDVAKKMVSIIIPQTYCGSIFTLACGIMFLALGVSFTVIADVVLNSGEGFVKAVSIRTGFDFGSMKVIFDVSLVILSIVIGILFFKTIKGVREGTVIAAVLSGFIIKSLNKVLTDGLNKWIAI